MPNLTTFFIREPQPYGMLQGSGGEALTSYYVFIHKPQRLLLLEVGCGSEALAS